jgi:hypothetical protein
MHFYTVVVRCSFYRILHWKLEGYTPGITSSGFLTRYVALLYNTAVARI